MGTLVYDPYVLNSILGPLLWRIMTCAQGPHMAKFGPDVLYRGPDERRRLDSQWSVT